MKRLRDYPWNVRLGVILAAIALVAASVIVSAEAQAAQHHHAHRAQTPTQLIQREVGPGTVVGPCWTIQRGVRCDYSTPASNVFEGEGLEGAVWSSYADVVRGRVLFP